MAFSGMTIFWMAFGCLFGPLFIVACIMSVVKAVRDRKRIKESNLAKKQARESVDADATPRQNNTVRKPNIMFIEDEDRKNKWKNHEGGSGKRSTRRSQGGDSGSGSVANGNGGQDVQVTVEHNTLCVPNGKGPTGLEEGLDNLGYSVNDARSSNRSSIEMDTLCCDVHESPVPTTPSDASSWQATTDVDTVSDPTTPIDRSPERGLSPSSRLLPNSAVHIDSKTPQSNGYTLSNNQQHGRSSPPPPSDGIDNVKLQDCNKNSKRQQQQKHKRGIRTKHEDPRKSNDTRKDNWHAREANGVRVLMTSQSEEHEFDLHSSHAVESARRNSYAAGIDVGYERDNDVSPSRSFSEDDLQRPQKFVSERNKGEINKAFIRSNDERFIEM